MFDQTCFFHFEKISKDILSLTNQFTFILLHRLNSCSGCLKNLDFIFHLSHVSTVEGKRFLVHRILFFDFNWSHQLFCPNCGPIFGPDSVNFLFFFFFVRRIIITIFNFLLNATNNNFVMFIQGVNINWKNGKSTRFFSNTEVWNIVACNQKFNDKIVLFLIVLFYRIVYCWIMFKLLLQMFGLLFFLWLCCSRVMMLYFRSFVFRLLELYWETRLSHFNKLNWYRNKFKFHYVFSLLQFRLLNLQSNQISLSRWTLKNLW